MSNLVASRRKRADWRNFEREQAALDEAVETGVAVDPFTFFHASSSPAHQSTCAKTYVVNLAPERDAAISGRGHRLPGCGSGTCLPIFAITPPRI